MAAADVQLTLHLTLPLAQLEPFLRHFRAYPGDPDDTIRVGSSLDVRGQMDRAEAVALLERLGFPLIVEHPVVSHMRGYPAEEDA
jgi:hypothetical protein